MVIHETKTHLLSAAEWPAAELKNPAGQARLLLVCEHASNMIPVSLDGLGLPDALKHSHIAFDPGAIEVAYHLSAAFDARLVASRVSRLVYDCNRPFTAEGAMPTLSEIHDIPGNRDLSEDHRSVRRDEVYQPFHDLVAGQVAAISDPIVVTIHSFTPIYKGVKRAVELGILHNEDTRLADALMTQTTELNMKLNEPYGPGDAVMHTVETHAEPNGHLNVMIEIANNLIANATDQKDVAVELERLLRRALSTLGEAP